MEEGKEERRDADRQAVLYVVTTQGGGKWKPEGAVTNKARRRSDQPRRGAAGPAGGHCYPRR